MSRSQYRRRLCFLLAVSFVFIGGFYCYVIRESIPDKITLETGSKGLLQLKEEPASFFSEEIVQTNSMKPLRIPNGAVKIEVDDRQALINEAVGTYTAEYKLLGFLQLKSVQVDVIEEQEVYPCGFPVGIYVETDGIMVIGSGKVTGLDGMEYEPAAQVLRSGDYITALDGQEVTTKEKFMESINEKGANPVVLDIIRNGKRTQVKLTPVQTGRDEYRLGVWIRDNTQGVGMLTFITKDGKYGALGHGITDVDTGLLMDIEEGRILDTKIVSIVKGRDGSPGELVGMIDYRQDFHIGTVSKNTQCGIFGNIDENVLCNMHIEPMEIALKQEMKTGAAVIRTNIDGEMKDYDINILEIDMNSGDDNKSFVIEVTDSRLIKKTGGIVQGMSGSPIIQDGRLVGAVTHVLVNDPTRGYGIFIENMLEH